MERMRVRTDLAREAKESFEGSDVEVHGVVVEEEYDEEKNLRLTRVRIESGRHAVCIRGFSWNMKRQTHSL